MRGAWAAFAKDPVYGLHSYDGWPNYKPKGSTLILLASGNNTKTNSTKIGGFNLGKSQAYDQNC
jgi:hypothetical protein